MAITLQKIIGENMKKKWENKQIKDLFDFVAIDLKNNVHTLESFRKYAKIINKNALSVRNFYYQQLKIFNDNKDLAKKLGIDLDLHKVKNVNHFNIKQETELKNNIESYIKKGYSVRKACAMLSDGNIQEMLRLQNKYRTIKKNENNNNKSKTTKIEDCKIIQFPQNNKKDKKQTLTDDEIKSLFMGLVKLVKENAIENSSQNMQLFLEQTEMQKRRELVLLKQKQTEIDNLNKEIANLKQKNKDLNEKLTDYRIKFLQFSNFNVE